MILVLLHMLIYRINNVHCISTNLNVPVLYLPLPCVSVAVDRRHFCIDPCTYIRQEFFNNISKFDLFDAQTIHCPVLPHKSNNNKVIFLYETFYMTLVRTRSCMGVERPERNSSKSIIRMLWMLRRKRYDDQ